MPKCNKDCFNCVYTDCTYNEPDTDRYRWCNRPQEYKRTQLAKKRALYYQRKDNGLCVHCGKPATHGVKCYEHYLRAKRFNEQNKGTKRELWQYLGKCYFCGGDVLPGRKTCTAHYNVFRRLGKLLSESEGGRAAQQKFVNSYRTAEKL